MRAYFDDGIITCPRCAFTKENVENIQSNLSDEPVQTYELKDDGVCLLTAGNMNIQNKNEKL
jgi:hypothetical protein